MELFDTLIFPLALLGCPILALAGLGCLLFCKGAEHYRYLVRTAAVFLGALAVMFGGEIVLGFFQLTWRNPPMLVLCGALLVSGWAGIILTLVCALPMEWPSVSSALRRAAKGTLVFFAAVVLLVTLWAGPLALAFAFTNAERRVEYEGQVLLEVDEGFLDPWYSYYAYHGPLVRGTERIYDGPTPIGGDFD